MSKSVQEITTILRGAKNVANNAQIVDLLQNNNIDLEGQHGETALHWSAYYGNITLVNMLIALGANINKQDKEKERTPLMWAMLRILRDPAKYSEIISILINFKADVSIRDYKKQNIFDIIKILREPNESLSFLNDFKIIDDSSLFKKEQKDHNLRRNISNFERNGDDSSDEEDTNTEKFNISEQWIQFTNSQFYNYLLKLGYQPWHIKLLFILHVNGIMFLYSPSVNAIYYNETYGKKVLGNNTTENDLKDLTNWIIEALYNTIHIVLCLGRQLTEIEKSEIIKKYCQTKADDFTQHLHWLLKKADLANAEVKLAKYNSSLNYNSEFVKYLRQANPELKGTRENTVIINSPEKSSSAVAQFLTQSNDNLQYINQCLYALRKMIIPVLTQKEDDLKSISKSETSLNLNNVAQVNNPIIEYFKLYFFKELSILRRKYQIMFNRGQNECVIYDFSQTFNNSNFWFNGVRKNNRFQKRRNHHFEERHFLAQNKSKKATQAEDLKVSYGHYIHTYSIWKLPSKTQVLYKDMITTNQIRNSLVEFKTAHSTTYTSLYLIIHEKATQYAMYYTTSAISQGQITELNRAEYYNQSYFYYTKRIALTIRSLLQGINPFTEQDSDADFISELTYLLFFCEASRNPASFVIHQMMLDLIIHNPVNRNWHWAFIQSSDMFGGGAMPMSIGNAVKFSGHINMSLAPYMPFPYIYGGDCEQNDDGIKPLVSKSLFIVHEWFQIHHPHVDTSTVDIATLSKLINETKWYTLPKHDPQVSELSISLQALSFQRSQISTTLNASESLLDTLRDGNCAFNALALGICELLENNMLPENPIFDTELSTLLGLTSKDRISILEWLRKNILPELRQKHIQSLLRKLAIDFIEKEYNSTYAQLYENLLVSAYLNYKLSQTEDDTFCVHKDILDYYKTFPSLGDLIKWWNDVAKNNYFKELRNSARNSLDKARWGCEVEIDAIATLLKINIIWKKQSFDLGQKLGIGGGLLDSLNDQQSKILTNLDIGKKSKGKFQLHCFKNISELEKRMNPQEHKECIIECIKTLMSQNDIYFPEIISNIKDMTALHQELIERNIINKDNNNKYRFILKDGLIDLEEITIRLNGIVDLDLKAKVISAIQYNIPEFGVIHNGNHWKYQRISTLEIQNKKDTPISQILSTNITNPVSSNNALPSNVPRPQC